MTTRILVLGPVMTYSCARPGSYPTLHKQIVCRKLMASLAARLNDGDTTADPCVMFSPLPSKKQRKATPFHETVMDPLYVDDYVAKATKALPQYQVVATVNAPPCATEFWRVIEAAVEYGIPTTPIQELLGLTHGQWADLYNRLESKAISETFKTPTGARMRASR